MKLHIITIGKSLKNLLDIARKSFFDEYDTKKCLLRTYPDKIKKIYTAADPLRNGKKVGEKILFGFEKI